MDKSDNTVAEVGKEITKQSFSLFNKILKRTPHRMALDGYISAVQQSEQLSPLEKAAYTWEAKKTIKKAVNALKVCGMAIEEGLNTRRLEAVDTDWLDDYLEKASNVSHEEIQLLWAKILNQEVEEPNSMPRALLHSLSIMGRTEAENFMKVASYCVVIRNVNGDSDFLPIIYTDKLIHYYGLTLGSLSALSAIGLLQFGTDLVEKIDDGDLIVFFGKTIDAKDIKQKKDIPIGSVILSHTGEALMKIVAPEEPKGFFEEVIDPLFHGKEIKWNE